MAEPRWRYFLWETDAVLTSSTNGEVVACSKPLDISDWDRMVVQFDVLDISSGLVAGDWQCTLEGCMSLGDFEAWQSFSWTNLPGSSGSSIDFDNGVVGVALNGFARWKIRHNVAGTHFIRVRIKVFLKSRASFPAPLEQLGQGVQQLAQGLATTALTPAAFVAAGQALLRTDAERATNQ